MLEVAIIALIMGVVAVPLMRGFGTFTRGMHRSTRQTGAVYLAQSIMEQIRRQVVIRRAGGPDFASLAEEGATVVTETGATGSRYFIQFENLEGTTLHGITAESDPELYRQLSRYSCSVEVLEGPSSGEIDSDANGRPELDMAEIGVTVSWEIPGAQENARRSTTLWTLVTGRDRGGRE